MAKKSCEKGSTCGKGKEGGTPRRESLPAKAPQKIAPAKAAAKAPVKPEKKAVEKPAAKETKVSAKPVKEVKAPATL